MAQPFLESDPNAMSMTPELRITQSIDGLPSYDMSGSGNMFDDDSPSFQSGDKDTSRNFATCGHGSEFDVMFSRETEERDDLDFVDALEAPEGDTSMTTNQDSSDGEDPFADLERAVERSSSEMQGDEQRASIGGGAVDIGGLQGGTVAKEPCEVQPGEGEGGRGHSIDIIVTTEPAIPSDSHEPQHIKAEQDHTSGCGGSRAASTPPGSPSIQRYRSHSDSPSPTVGITWVGSTHPTPSKAATTKAQPNAFFQTGLTRGANLHVKAKELRPRLQLPAHRYWVGVLNYGVKARNAKGEKDFTWMKANRITTVRTVWQAYHTTTATTKFLLVLNGEIPAMTDRLEELDFLNDHTVIFQAMAKDDPELPGNVIEIEDD